MVVETTKNQITLNRIVGQKKESRLIENDIIVNDIKPDVLNIISTNGVVSIYKKEAMEGKVRIDGTINAYVIYLADDEKGSIRSLNTSLDFTQLIDVENCNENMQLEADVNIKSFETKIINGRKLNIKANIETNITVYSNENFDVITDIKSIQNVQILNNTQKIASLIGNGKNKSTIKDTIAIDQADDFGEIMKVEFKIVDEETKISYNKVLSKADAQVEIMYLTEDNRINTVTTKIPIMGFVDIQNITDTCQCKVKNCLSNLIVKPNAPEEHSIYVEAEIEICCSAYETKDINIIQDLYSITDDIDFSKRDVTVITEMNNLQDVYTIKENLRIPELTGRILDVNINPDITNTQVRKNKIIYEGNIGLEILLEGNSGITSKLVELPFNFEIMSDTINEKSLIRTEIAIKQNDFIIKDGNIEVTIGLEFKTLEQKNNDLSIIEQINSEEAKECSTYSMVIYFVKPGDTLWKIAKKFRSTVEDIARINGIENADKIDVGKQLYIPRFCGKKIAV